MNKYFSIIVIIVIASLVACNKDNPENITKYDKEGVLRDVAEQNNRFLIGSLYNYSFVKSENEFAQLLADEFNIISGEWELGMEEIWIGPNQYNFKYADSLLQFAKDNNQKVKWTHLVWHGSLPEFPEFYNYSDSEFEQAVFTYIDTIMTHCKTYYPGVVFDYNVVNEVLDHDSETMFRQSIFLEKMGNDFVEKCFIRAHQADPDAKLYICEYDFLGNSTDNQDKQDYMYELVSSLVNNNIPIDGVAEQCHINTEYIDNIDFYTPQDMQYWSDIIDLYDNLGLKFEVSELTIEINNDGTGVNDEKLNRQAEIIGEIVNLLKTKPNAEALIFWGLTDAHNYLGTSEYPCLFDKNYEPKPMYFKVYDELKQ